MAVHNLGVAAFPHLTCLDPWLLWRLLGCADIHVQFFLLATAPVELKWYMYNIDLQP